MNTWLNYIVEANIGLLLFLLLYKALLSKETQFSYRRFYLLGALLLSLLFPWLTIGTPAEVVPTLSETLPDHWLPTTIEQTQAEALQPTFNFWELAFWLYGAVVALLFLRFVYQIIMLMQEARKGKSDEPVIEVDNASFIAFSFFKLVFISKAFNLTEADKQRILQHEHVHISKWHSVDMVLIELVRILFWFNPLLSYYKKEMSMVHEFEADEVASGSEHQDQYCSLLARSAIESSGYVLANHFNNSLTLKRITMIRTLKQKVKQWKTGIVFLFVSVLFLGIACQDQIAAEMNGLSQTTTVAGDFPDHLLPVVEQIKKENPGIKLMYVEAESINEEKIRSLNPNKILHTSHTRNMDDKGNIISERVELIIKTDDSISQLGDMTKSDDDVFLVVEANASPIGGMTALYEAINRELKFPEQAVKMGIEGKVFVEIIIEPDGSTSNHRPLKGIGAGCDEEAVRALKAANVKWNPGKQRGVAVRQKFVIPITFTLSDDASTGTVIPKEKKMIISSDVSYQNGKTIVNGTVTTEDGKPIPGMNIVVSGKTYGTVSKADGTFSLALEENSGELSFSFIGFETQKVRIN
ncbi:MAG: TonB family protein [Cyclobacteriaceae bacterium]|nr:MAG: TonB family protein [Cyclobacteriaceae bacterium]